MGERYELPSLLDFQGPGHGAEPAAYTLSIAVDARKKPEAHHFRAFPGPLLSPQEGKQIIVNIHNQTDSPEQLRWCGQFLPLDVNGAEEDGNAGHRPGWKRHLTFVLRLALCNSGRRAFALPKRHTTKAAFAEHRP
jgi:FtsP/CotA-like multicopper oxidase with cupredoxin domain